MTLRSAAIVLCVLVTRTAAADSGIVLESYTGTRPPNASALLGPVLEELSTRGFAVGYDGFGRKFEGEVSRPGRTAGGLPADFTDGVDRGHKAWIKGNFDDVVAILTPLVEAAHGNAAVVAQDQRIRDALQRGLVDLALAQQRRGDPTAARETIGELLRAFPEAMITRAAHGPEAFELYETTRKALVNGGRGTLSIEVVDAGTVVFVDEHYERVGAVRKPDLYPGTYRVYASAGQREGRIYKVVVRAGAETRLTVDAAFDAVLHVAPDWTGMAFTTGADRDRVETAYAAKLARLANATAVAVVGIDTVRDRPAVVGSLVSLHSGRELRRASVPIDPQPSSERLVALARYLAGDDTARADLDVEDPGERLVDGTRDQLPRRAFGYSRRWGAWRFVTTGLGLALAGAGTYFLVVDGNCKETVTPPMQCTTVYETAAPGWGLVGGGAALTGLGIYMFATDRQKHAYAVVPHRGGAIAVVSLRF